MLLCILQFVDGCGYDEFLCYDSSCIPNYFLCNNQTDCSYGEDEYGCGTSEGLS